MLSRQQAQEVHRMTSGPVSVSAVLQVSLVVPDAASAPVEATLSYVIDDPYAVRIAFRTRATVDAVEWTFARQLLTNGVTAPAGDGDVRTWPSHTDGEPVVCLSLCSPSGTALFEIPVTGLVEFLTRTYAQVPTGSESAHVDVDRELADLLGPSPGP
jgi:hypothetical protein